MLGRVVEVTHARACFCDPETIGVRSAGQTIVDALQSLGYQNVADVRQGKYFELDLATTERPQAEKLAADVADKVLANPVIETYRIEVGLIMRFGIVVFPGSNCDEDAFHTAKDVFGQDAEYLWHKDADLKAADVVILPGGFAHGDYLRTGAMARFSPIMAPGSRVRGTRRAGARHLQRFPNPARGRIAAGRDAAQQRAEVSVRARPPARRADRHAVHCGCDEWVRS